MNSAAAIIEALNARAAPPARLREAARESWSAWIDRATQRPGRVTGAPADDVVAQLAAREPASPPARAVELNRWQAFATLWRQNWQPAPRDERRWRWTAGGVSFAWHVVMAILLLVVTALHVVAPRPREDEVVQVEYVGVGTPAEEGGGPTPSPATRASEESPAAAASSAAASAASSAAAASPAQPAVQPAEAATSPPAAEPQPLTVTTPASPEPPTFVLPPTSPPAPAVEVLHTPAPAVRVVPIPELARAPEATAPSEALQVEAIRAPMPSVAVRQVPEPQRLPTLTTPVPTAVEVPRASAPPVAVQARAIPAAPSTTSTTPSPAAAAPASTRTSPAARAATSGPVPASPSAGVGIGPKPTPAPGAWATPKRADDWGQSDRNKPGNDLFDGDGRPRLADGPGSASAGHPPGMITQEIRDIDRAGTWLRRKPFPYEPTRWDRLWKPNQTLLDDWVEKGVKQVGIPIPGTTKRIVCVISILQLGGGCGIADPNLNEQPATARPPPAVPFKPGLQEGNGATWDRDGKPAPMPKLPGLFAPPKNGVPPGTTVPDEPKDEAPRPFG